MPLGSAHSEALKLPVALHGLMAIAPAACASALVACGACGALGGAVNGETAGSPALSRLCAALEKLFPVVSTCVTFSLGFFLSATYARWWKLRDLAGAVLGRSIDTMVMICTYLNGADARACEGRRRLARYLLMAHVVSLQAGHKETRLESLYELGLIDKDSEEQQALAQAKTARYNIAYQWFLSSFYAQLTHAEGMVGRGNIMYQVQTNVSHMRGGSADIVMYLNQRIPETITAAVHGATFLYCTVVMPVTLASQMRWYAAPCSAVVTSFFYLLYVSAREMQDPFNGTLCAFDTNAFLRTTQQACDDLLNLRADISRYEMPFTKMTPQANNWSDNENWGGVCFGKKSHVD